MLRGSQLILDGSVFDTCPLPTAFPSYYRLETSVLEQLLSHVLLCALDSIIYWIGAVDIVASSFESDEIVPSLF